MSKPKALVLLSGGLDSATCLYYALDAGYSVVALSFDYQQRHQIELEYARELAKTSGVEKHIVFNIDLRQIGASALTSEISVPKGGADLEREDIIPITYVPARNLVFLSIASAVAEAEKITSIFIGANALDYSGYPDCRPDFFNSFTDTVNLATREGREGRKFEIITPLLGLTKKEIIELALKLKLPIEKTWSCYDPQGDQPCGECDACLLRDRAAKEAGL